ncbi:DUF1236 domain-containing protein [Rhodoligotrophos defluvii]|uniref:DUF1236 domain-containing protein n=1 Tax=Rhodoligotrophos defluvii TaxID=2561934 RepID=UPI0010C9E766|nr:DUF1236 domain-containing protein [Rhodoligotrophos defluvii]
MKSGKSMIAAMLLLAGTAAPAFAQTTTVVLPPEKQTVVKEYVTKHSVAPVTLPGSVELEVGATLPAEVELHTIEGVPEVSEYRYVIVDGRTVLVEPGSRRIVQIID